MGLRPDAVRVVLGSVLIALCAQISIPLNPVPITGQTLGVLLAGAVLGSRLGALSVVLYLAEGLAAKLREWRGQRSKLKAALEAAESQPRETKAELEAKVTRAVQMLRPGQHTEAHRHVCCTNYHVIEGAGYSLVGGERLAWEDKDVFTVPTWTLHEHVNTGNGPAFLFSFTDAPVMKALDLYREEAKR